jgi:DNA repair photolyase
MFGKRAPRSSKGQVAPPLTAPTGNLPARGRGAATLNPQNRFEKLSLHVLGDHLDEEIRDAAQPSNLPSQASRTKANRAAGSDQLATKSGHDSRGAESPRAIPLKQVQTVALRDDSRTIINRVVDSPDIGFDWTINPYRGCEHGCIYCYARPTHEYLGLSCGLDFETKIMVKKDAPAMLRRELASPKWKGETIVLSGVTDCYQPLEAKMKITRGILEVCREFNQPVSIITKNHLVTRDIDVLADLARASAARVSISITTLDATLARTMEPRASSPRDRLKAVRELSDAGIPVAVMTAPIIPGLNDREIPALLEAAKDAGALSAGWVMMRLPYQLKALFLEWLQREYPEKAQRVEHLIREVRGGNLSDPRFGSRMRGEGETARIIKRLFDLHARKRGLNKGLPPLSSAGFRRPGKSGGQMPLFM